MLHLLDIKTIKNTIFEHDRPSYLTINKYRLFANYAHLISILPILTSNDNLLSLIIVLYITSDLLWHNIKDSKDILLLKYVHSFLILSIAFYVLFKVIKGYIYSKNIKIFIPFIIYFLIEHCKGNNMSIKDIKTYNIYVKFEPFIHLYIWLALFYMNITFPEFNNSCFN